MNPTTVIDVSGDFLWGLLVDWIAYLGIYLSLGLEMLPFRKLGFAISATWQGLINSQGEGKISSFAALMTALGGNIGTGCLAGMAITMSVGGPGSLFWLWVVTLVSLATRFTEAALAVHFRTRSTDGSIVGGPMYYMRIGLPAPLRWLGVVFAAIGSLTMLIVGNNIQAMELAKSLEHIINMPHLLSGLLLAAATFFIIQGGITRISATSSFIVPLMLVAYLVYTSILLLSHPESLLRALESVVKDALSGQAMAGGSVLIMITSGVRRAVFTQETGIGTTPIVHAIARPDDPFLQGMVAVLGNLITAIVSTMTALVVICSDSHLARQDGHTLIIRAFEWGWRGSGWVSDLATILFTFTTIIVFAYYTERCLEFLFGTRSNKPFRLVWAAALVVGCVTQVPWIWFFADTTNALMALPNVLALVILSTVAFRLAKHYDYRPS